MQPTEFWQQYAALTRRAVETQWRLARDYGEVSARAIRGQTDVAAPAAWLRSVGTETGRWWREAARLGLAYGGSLLELNSEVGSRLVGAAGHHTTNRLTVTLSGPGGSTVSTPLTVANSRATREQVSFRPGLLCGDNGAEVDGAWAFDPPTLDLGPGEEQQVAMSLRLDKKLLAAGSTWRGVVSVQDSNGVVMEVDVHVEVDVALQAR